jgi:NADH-quinone oxidoreductase subunit J
MTVVDSLFVFFSLALVLSALMVILSPNPVASALYLVLVFLFTAGLYILLQAFFLAVLQILVYAGAIMVLFLFVIMLMDQREPARWWIGNLPALVGGPLIGLAFGAAVGATLRRTTWTGTAPESLFRGDLVQVMTPVFARFLLPVEITGVLLLVATIGVVVLTRREGRP